MAGVDTPADCADPDRGSEPDTAPVLIGCAHGTRDPAGRRVMARLRLDVAARRPGLTVLAASVDVQKPALDDVVSRLARQDRPAVVVPLLLSAGYHMAVDVREAVRIGRRLGGRVVAAPALGPDDALVDVLVERLAECGIPVGQEVVLAAAGSSDPSAVADVEQVAQALARRRGSPVRPAYLSATAPTVAQALAGATQGGARVSVATYLLAPGFFADRLARQAPDLGADRVSAPLAPHPRLAELVLSRYDQARQALRGCGG